jgi:hypothetical protein
MGAKIPFRFPMIDQLVPVVQMYDVSNLVSAPVEPRGLVGFEIESVSPPAPNPFTLVLSLHSLGPGGILIDFLALHASIDHAWTILVTDVDVTGLLLSIPKQDVGGTSTRTLVRARELLHTAGLSGGGSFFPATVTINASPRFLVPAGKFVYIQGPKAAGGESMTATVSWAELPASFENP